MGALAVTAVNVVGAAAGQADDAGRVWVSCAVLALWSCTLVFAALGVFVGYLVPGENVMQVLGPGLALLAFLGGVFIPLDRVLQRVWHIAYWTPMYGVAEIARAPLHRRAALVRRAQRRGLAGGLRRRRRVADEQGHRPGLSAGALR